MASRLYPGFGSGKGVFDERFDCRSFASVGRSDMEAGDKLFLPSSAFKEISRLKLPFPLTFKVQNERTKPSNIVPTKDGKQPPTPPEQFAGVLEFSAPEGVAYLPTWMLQNLKVRDGGKAQFTTVRDLPRGTYAKLQPYSQAFVDLAASVGPRDLLEVALRNYSALSQGERIMIDVADEKYFVDVIEVKPGKAISIYGNVDLEVDFAPIKGSIDDINEAKTKAAETGSKEDKAAAAAKVAAAEAAEIKAANNAVLNAKKALAAAGGGDVGGGGILSSSTAVAAATVLSETTKKSSLTPIKSPNTNSGKISTLIGTPPSTSTSSPLRSNQSPSSKPSLLKQLAEKVSASPTLPSLLKSGSKVITNVKSSGVLSPDIFNMPMAFFDEYGGTMEGVDLTSTFTASLPPSSPIIVPAAVSSPGRTATLGSPGRVSTVVSSLSSTKVSSQTSSNVAATQNQQFIPANLLTTSVQAPKPDAKALAKMREERAKAAMARMATLAQTASQGSEGKEDSGASESKHVDGNSAPATPQRTNAALSRAPAALAPPPEKRIPLVHGGGGGGGGKEDENDPPKVLIPTPRSPVSALVEADDDGISPSRRCRFCLQDIPRNAFDLHSARCARNSSYHKTVCTVCGAQMYVKDLEKHVHCSLGCGSLLEVDIEAKSIASTGVTDGISSMSLSVPQLISAASALHAQVCPKRISSCECGFTCAFESLDTHRLQCPSAKSSCKYCKVIFKKIALQSHEDKCGSRTMACEICSRLVVVRNMAAHVRDGTCPGPGVQASSSLPIPPVLPATVATQGEVSSLSGEGTTVLSSSAKSTSVPTGSLVARKLQAAKKLSTETAKKDSESKEYEDESNESSTKVTTLKKSTSSRSGAGGGGEKNLSARPSTREDPLYKAAIAESLKTVQPIVRPSSQGGAGPKDEKKSISHRSAGTGNFAFPCPHCNKNQKDYEALQIHVFTDCKKAGIVNSSAISSSSLGNKKDVRK